MSAKTYTIAAPIPNMPYSRREVVFEEAPSDQQIAETVELFSRIEQAFMVKHPLRQLTPADTPRNRELMNTPGAVLEAEEPINIQLLREEHKQLKDFQDRTMQQLEWLKQNHPDIFKQSVEIVI